MTAKGFLLQITRLRSTIYRLQELVTEYERLSSSIPGQDFSHERVDGTRSYQAPFEKWIHKKIEAKEKIKEHEVKLLEVKSEFIDKIGSLENEKYYRVLMMRYYDCMEIEDIAEQLNYCDRWVYTLLKDAERAFAKVYEV